MGSGHPESYPVAMTRVADSSHRWSARLQEPGRHALVAADRTVTEMTRMLDASYSPEAVEAAPQASGALAQAG